MDKESNFRIAILASGDRKTGEGGSTADKVTRDSLEGKVNFTVGVVVCNNPKGTVAVHDRFNTINTEFGLKGENKIDVVTINSTTHPSEPQSRGQTLEESSAICRLLEQRNIGFAVMLGYSKVITGEFVSRWGWRANYGSIDPAHNGIYHPKARISNNHPAILPYTSDTHGIASHALVIRLFKEGKLKNTAMTFHLGAVGIDTGPVIYEEPVPIYKNDDAESLAARVQSLEKEITAQTIERHLILRAEHINHGLTG